MMVLFYSCFFFLSFSTSFYVGSYTLADSKNNLLNDGIWESREFQTGQNELDSNRKRQSDLSNFENENQIAKADAFAEGNGGKRKWSSVLTFDRLKNLTEKDKGPCNDTKIILINSEDHLTIYENDDDENEIGVQGHDEQRFGVLSPEGFLSRIHSSEEKGLERTKRQAEGGKKKCRCRKKGRRGMRRRRRRRRGRRRRVGQTRPARRPRRGRRRGRRRGAGRRRGRRRCVCRKKEGDEGDEGDEGNGGEGEGGGEGKGDEDPEVEEAESTTTEGGGGSNNEEEEGDEGEGKDEGDEGGEGNEGDEGDEGNEDEEEGENEDSDEENASDDESDEKKGSGEGSLKNKYDTKEIPVGTINHEKPVYVMYPGTPGAYGATPNAAGAPVYTTYPVPFSPYPYYTGSHSTLHGKNDPLSKV